MLRRTILILGLVALVAPLAAFADDQIVVVVPNDMTAEATGPQGSIVTFTASAHRGTSQLTVTCVPASGSRFAIRRTTVDCSATDQGETNNATFHITVQDTTGPVVTVPGDMHVDATSPEGAVVTFSASANDLVDGPRPVTCTPPSGTRFPIGNTRVTCRSSDTRNNTGSASFNIHVADLSQRPVITITVPANMLVEAQSFSGAAVTYTASAVDHLGRPIPVTCSPPSGSEFGFGDTTVSCSATDAGSGEPATKSFKITVVDDTPPAITVPASKRVTAPSRAEMVVRYAATAVDRVDGPVAVSCKPASGSHFAVGTTKVTCTAVDRRNNASSASFVVIVVFSTRSTQAAAMLSPAAGARISAPPLLRWHAVRKATFYNVQVFRNGQKVLSVWPSRPRFRLRGGWTFDGQRYRLRPGSYTWIVWPAYGSTSRPRFGRVLGLSSFVVVKRAV